LFLHRPFLLSWKREPEHPSNRYAPVDSHRSDENRAFIAQAQKGMKDSREHGTSRSRAIRLHMVSDAVQVTREF
jgi:hypothetical protein